MVLDNVTLVAGHQLYQDELSEFKTQDFTETFETNVYPVFWTVQKALEYLQPGGSITTTSSVQGYNPSQFFMIMLQRKLQLYL